MLNTAKCSPPLSLDSFFYSPKWPYFLCDFTENRNGLCLMFRILFGSVSILLENHNCEHLVFLKF